MHIEQIVRRTFMKTVNVMDINPDLKSSVLSHERKELFIKNMIKQLNEVRILRFKQGKKPLLDSTYEWAAGDMTKMFVEMVKGYSEERVKSTAEKSRVKAQADFMVDIEKTLAGTPSGDFDQIVKAVGDGDAVQKVEVTDV